MATPDPATILDRLSKLEAENDGLRQKLADAEGGRDQLLMELQHRVRNLLSIIRSVARRTARTSESAEDYAVHLDGRLAAMARAQAVIIRAPTRGIFLDYLIAEELLAHASHAGERVQISGPPVRLTARAGETLWLAVHELVANAVEHGALSHPNGRLGVTWAIEPGPDTEAGQVLRLDWRETGLLLPVEVVRPQGFGTELIERTLAYQLGATAVLDFGPDGVHCTIVLPLGDDILAGDPAAPSA